MFTSELEKWKATRGEHSQIQFENNELKYLALGPKEKAFLGLGNVREGKLSFTLLKCYFEFILHLLFPTYIFE